MKISFKFIIIITLISFTLQAQSVEVSGKVVQIIKANQNIKSDFERICITYIKVLDSNRIIGLVEDYYFCTLARKYKIGNILKENIAKNIILSAEEIEPELNLRLQDIHSNADYMVIDY